MANTGKKGEKGFVYWVKRLWNNFIVRNIVLAVSAIIILIGLASLLLNVFTRHNKYKDVPDFVGTSMEQARELAQTDKLRIEVNDSLYVPTFTPGIILEQRPDAGTKVKSGRRIFVTVNSYRQKMVDVPYVAGFSLRQAKNLLETAGLEIGKLIYVDDIATNNVLSQSVNGRQVSPDDPVKAEIGTGVDLTVGRAKDAEPLVVPKVAGLPLFEAKSRLWDIGLNIGRVTYDNNINMLNQKRARIYLQEPVPGCYMPLGTPVAVYLTIDSLTLANGMREMDDSSRKNMRLRAVTDSLVRAGMPAHLVQPEAEYILRRERGELTPADSVRSAHELLRMLDTLGGDEVEIIELIDIPVED